MIALAARDRRQPADVGAAFLLRHELRALREARHVGLRQPVEIFRLAAPSSPKRDSSIAAPSVTLIGQPRPNSAWLNR